MVYFKGYEDVWIRLIAGLFFIFGIVIFILPFIDGKEFDNNDIFMFIFGIVILLLAVLALKSSFDVDEKKKFTGFLKKAESIGLGK